MSDRGDRVRHWDSGKPLDRTGHLEPCGLTNIIKLPPEQLYHKDCSSKCSREETTMADITALPFILLPIHIQSSFYCVWEGRNDSKKVFNLLCVTQIECKRAFTSTKKQTSLWSLSHFNDVDSINLNIEIIFKKINQSKQNHNIWLHCPTSSCGFSGTRVLVWRQSIQV